MNHKGTVALRVLRSWLQLVINIVQSCTDTHNTSVILRKSWSKTFNGLPHSKQGQERDWIDWSLSKWGNSMCSNHTAKPKAATSTSAPWLISLFFHVLWRKKPTSPTAVRELQPALAGYRWAKCLVSPARFQGALLDPRSAAVSPPPPTSHPCNSSHFLFLLPLFSRIKYLYYYVRLSIKISLFKN